MDRKRIIGEKKAKIKEVEAKQRKLVMQAVKLLKKPWRRKDAHVRRCEKAIALIMAAKMLEAQRHMIAATPFPKVQPGFVPGGNVCNGMAIVGDLGHEAITLNNGSTIEVQKLPIQFDPSMIPKLSDYANKQGHKEG